MKIWIILAVTLNLTEKRDKIKSYSAIKFSQIHCTTTSNSTGDETTISEHKNENQKRSQSLLQMVGKQSQSTTIAAFTGLPVVTKKSILWFSKK